MKTTFLNLIVLLLVNAPMHAYQTESLPEPRTEAAVIADDKAWTAAEEKGDVAFVDSLLLPEYRSISPDGSIHNRAAILANTRKATSQRSAMIEKYITDHPANMNVTMNGDTAVLTFTSKGDAKQLIRSCDIFLYRNGHWHAIYSQHTTAERL
jgi:hypothetical protein